MLYLYSNKLNLKFTIMNDQLTPDYYEFENGFSDREYCKVCGEPLDINLDFGLICPNCADDDHDENLYL